MPVAMGSQKALEPFEKISNLGLFIFFKNMEPADFLRLLYHSKCLIGNSSVGIRECSLMGYQW